ncbi:hypothetical protein MYX75_04725 [Acidobacteria bacterium AH-259-A15]|nr:hypothetical protein [Acidobacteria bacterium AH-259-A15]
MTDLEKAKSEMKKLDLFISSKIDKTTGKVLIKKGEDSPISAEGYLTFEKMFKDYEANHFKAIQDSDLGEELVRELAEIYKEAVEARDRLGQLMSQRPYTGRA